MAKNKSKPMSPFHGRWRIVSMSMWDDEYLNEGVEAYIEFDESGVARSGSATSGGVLDDREGRRDGRLAAEFSWEGGDGADGTPLTGRGWAMLKDESMHGIFAIHIGDASEFEAVEAART